MLGMVYIMLTLKGKKTQQQNWHLQNTVELQWLEHLWNRENMFETGVVRAN